MDTLREKLAQLWEPIQTEINRLSSRERLILLITTVSIFFLVSLALLIWVGSSASGLDRKIAKSKTNIQEIIKLGQIYQAKEAQISELDRRMLQTPKDFRLATELEKIANASGIQIDSFKERPGSPHEFYEENQVLLSIKEVDIRSLIDFLQSIENARRFMLITNLNIKPGFKDPTKLNVQAVISTFSPI